MHPKRSIGSIRFPFVAPSSDSSHCCARQILPVGFLVRPLSMTISVPEIGNASPSMPNTDRHLPIHCPKCRHVGCTLLVKGITIITVTCVSCAHTWATKLDFLPDDIQGTVLAILSQI